MTGATRAEWRAFKAQLQEEPYDAVIDLQGLTKSAIVAKLARGTRFGLANQTEGSSWEAPASFLVDHAIRVEPHIHAMALVRPVASKPLTRNSAPAVEISMPTR